MLFTSLLTRNKAQFTRNEIFMLHWSSCWSIDMTSSLVRFQPIVKHWSKSSSQRTFSVSPYTQNFVLDLGETPLTWDFISSWSGEESPQTRRSVGEALESKMLQYFIILFYFEFSVLSTTATTWPHGLDPDAIGVYKLSSQEQCKRLCWNQKPCARVSFAEFADGQSDIARGRFNCVLHDDRTRSPGHPNWVQGEPSQVGKTLQCKLTRIICFNCKSAK